MQLDLVRQTALGAVTGLVAGAVVLAFRWVIEVAQSSFLPNGQMGNYEALPGWAIVALPTVGGLLLGLAFARLPEHLRSVGIVHVIQQLRHTGRPDLPIKNAIVQFVGGAFAIVTGHSVDREGPGVHLGAAAGTQVGRRSEDAETFTLTACGGAAAIAAAFNTPLAGIVFVIEVLGIRYRVDRFIPIIAASVIGALISRAVYGSSPSFIVLTNFADITLAELPLIALLGAVTGLAAVLFIQLAEITSRYSERWSPILAFTLAGLITGIIGLAYPQILGVSYDTLDGILSDQLVGPLLAGLVVAKIVATGISVGLRVPGGLIGPSLVIGGALGGFAGHLVQQLPIDAASASFYATIGMIALMSAALRAPLAALFALLELTANPNVIFPGMTAIVCADLVSRQLLGNESIFEHIRRVTETPVNDDSDVRSRDDT